jgi:hypothetical protein
MKHCIFLFLIVCLCSCVKEISLDENILSDYLELNDSLEVADLVACAGGKIDGLLGDASKPTDVFFYPIQGATDFRYFEAENIADSLDFSKYSGKELDDEPIFNGYLWKFNNTPFEGERTGIVTYRTPGNIHVCNYIRLKTNMKPTERNADLGQIINIGVTPTFVWEDGEIKENVIYFQVISDIDGNLISGTYTTEKQFDFYDTSNVVFNITDPDSEPTLQSNTDYNFTLMGVSEDNWVNLLIEKSFITE